MQGFRPGKVPPRGARHALRRAMGEVLDAAASIRRAKDLIEQKKLRPALQPEDQDRRFEKATASFAMDTLEVLPEVPALDFGKFSVDEYQYELPENEGEGKP